MIYYLTLCLALYAGDAPECFVMDAYSDIATCDRAWEALEADLSELAPAYRETVCFNPDD